MKRLTPLGIRDLVPEETQHRQQLVQSMSKTFETQGYQHIQTPTLEFSEALGVGMGPQFKHTAIQFFDPSGQLLVLRPDHTIPIARLVATRMQNAALPLKLYYSDAVFRQPVNVFEQDIETFQSGVELIGAEGPQAEAELIHLMILTLQNLGVKDFGIDIGHTDFITTLPKDKKEALVKGDYLNLGYIPKRGKEEVIANTPSLTHVYTYLKSHKLDHYVHFNQGLVKELHYYTGLIFECYIPSVRQSVGSGGRYDTLMEKFGFKCPAIGFAFNLNRLSQWKSQ